MAYAADKTGRNCYAGLNPSTLNIHAVPSQPKNMRPAIPGRTELEGPGLLLLLPLLLLLLVQLLLVLWLLALLPAALES
jgi:hypothetical protein